MDLELNTSTAVEVAVESAIHEIDSLTVSMDGTDALEVTFDSNEFSIVGDDMVIVTKYEDAPQWLKDTIDNVVNIKTAVAVGDLNATKEALDVMLGELEVAKNTYQLSIISSADIDNRITTAITSLNSALRDADATILEVANTAVTPSEASAIALNTLSASLSSNGEIGSALHNLQTAMTTLENTTASDISYLESTMEGEIVGNANAMQTIRTYVGIDEAGASTGTGLSAYLEGNDGNFGSAGSQLNNDIKVTAEGIESKWAYNSSLNINGVSYNSGFGLATNLTNSSIPVGQSEFWITADKFKITNATNNRYQPFSINGNSIVFNGKVTFGGTQVGTVDEAIAAVVQTVSVGDKNINITDNLIPITSLVADTDNSGYQFVSTPTKSNSAGIDTYAEAQIVLDGSDEVYSPYVDDSNISYYYRFGIKGITSGSVFKIVTINSSNVATSNTVTITMNSGQSITAGNWYIIEGLINPTGGDSSAVGSIRNSTGTKIGTVNSFVLPSGTSKVVLGWVANCTISRIKLCKVTADTVTSDLTTVNAQIALAQSSADTANSLLADIANDNKLTAVEKSSTQTEWTRIQSEYTKNISQANTYGVSTTAYTTTYNALSSYITPLLTDITTTSTIVGTTFRTTFKSYYDADVDLLSAIRTVINSLASTANSTANSANSLANTANTNALARPLPSEVAAAVNNNTTTINGSKITTGSISAAQIAAGSISADRITSTTGVSTAWIGGGLVSQNFNGNPYGSIGNPTSGFRLSSNAVGTSNDPNIYGAYIKGGTIDGVSLSGISLAVNDIKVRASSYPSNFGPLSLRFNQAHSGAIGGGSHSVISTNFKANSYGTGYDNSRMCPDTIVFNISAYTCSSASDISYITWISSLTVQYSTNDGSSWITLYSGGQAKRDHAYSTTLALSSSTNIMFKAISSYMSPNVVSTLVLNVSAENYS